MISSTVAPLAGLFVACAFGVPLPEDFALLSAGLLVSAGTVPAPVVFAVAWTAIAFGDSTQFFVGRTFGPRIFERDWMRRLVTPRRRAVVEARLRRWGPLACVGARFLPGARIPMYVVAGASGVRPGLFLALDGVAAAVSVSFWLFVGHRVGGHVRDAFGPLAGHGRAIAIGAALAAVGWFAWRELRRVRKAAGPDGSAS